MFSVIRGSAFLAILAGMLSLAPFSSAAQAATDRTEEGCAATVAGRCYYTAGREGVHRIQLALPASHAGKLRELSIGGQQCPLMRQPTDDGTVSLACFAYLSGGVTYQLSVPADTPVSIVKADPANGEPVTLIP
ncbi:hypothetical protein [Niveispirillum sp. KHB5.9]|uniref:hypothetical protein n=1 Tax=Niveispirillum sp. KHB5.9 TaxID=3400269 RepID=UPI003A8B4705